MNANDLADLYLRVSIDREEREGIDWQEADCRSWAERSGLSVRKVHVERGRSGYRNVSRVGFEDAITAVTSGIVGTLVVWKLDRLSRRGIGEVADVLQAFDEMGGRLVSVVDRLDTSTDFGRGPSDCSRSSLEPNQEARVCGLEMPSSICERLANGSVVALRSG